MRILIVGGGGREHAIAWAVSKSSYVEKTYVAPGNPGCAEFAELVNISDRDIRSLASFAENKHVDLTIVGPETPLAMGIVDYFRKRKLRIFGPTLAAAEIESSKIFAKYFMRKYNIPTASFKDFESAENAIKFLETREFPIVIKTDGLAAGKGAIIANNLSEAKDAILHMMIEQNFGQAGKRVVIEQFLTGPEISFMGLADGKNVVPLISSMDYKRAQDGGRGPNTGGMGALAPHPLLTPELEKTIMENVMYPAINGLRYENKLFTGILYAGVILTPSGPKVLEFNCRFGDPETQTVLPLLETDFIEMLLYTIEEKLDEFDPVWKQEKALSVVMASGGYPKRFRKGFEISGLDKVEDSIVFQAGTSQKGTTILSDGGRVLAVTSTGNTYDKAAEKSYRSVKKINFKKSIYRTDIGKPFLKHK